VPVPWTDTDLDELIEDVLVDAYGDAEQLSSFECGFEDVDFPVPATALGKALVWTGVRFDGDERRGLEACMRVDGRVYRISLLDIEATDDTHDAARSWRHSVVGGCRTSD
jgi:hypothetical protein